MSDEKLSLFPGLKTEPQPPEPSPPPPPQFQIPLEALGQELAELSTMVAQTTTEEEISEAIGAITPRLENLMNASAFAVSERVGAIQDPIVVQALTAILSRLEINRWALMFMVDPVGMSPAVAKLREEAEAAEDDDES